MNNAEKFTPEQITHELAEASAIMSGRGNRANLVAIIEQLQAEKTTLATGIEAVNALMRESEGVAGLHRNGDIAPWDELLAGGRFGCWLKDFSMAVGER
jgi:hypothetical protein